MPITLACPACAAQIRVPDQLAGKQAKCPKCATVIDVPAPSAASQEDTPNAAPRKSRKKLYIGLGALTLLLLSCCCLGGGVGGGMLFIPDMGGHYYYLTGEWNRKVTKANFDQLKENMTLADIEKILGPGRPTRPDDVRWAFKNNTKQDADKAVEQHQKMIDRNADYCWRNSNEIILVVFGGPAKEGGKTTSLLYADNSSKLTKMEVRGFIPNK